MSVAGATLPNLVAWEPKFLSSCAYTIPQGLVIAWQEVKLIGMGTEGFQTDWKLHDTLPLEFQQPALRCA